MRSFTSALLLALTLATPVFASDDVLEIDQTCAVQTGCFAGDAQGSSVEIAVPYGLTANSAWVEGCIVGPCLCLVAYRDDLTGSFLLAELPTLQPGPWRLFEVRDVQWTFGRGDTKVEIRGGGTYRTAAPVLDQHRLVLDLYRDGISIGTLDSGDVAGALSFPKIAIQALTSGICVQQGIQLAAAPVPEPSIALLMGAGIVGLVVGARIRQFR